MTEGLISAVLQMSTFTLDGRHTRDYLAFF